MDLPVKRTQVYSISILNGLNIFDIPLDPANFRSSLNVSEKTADKDTLLEIGEFVKYTLTLKNNLPEATIYNTRIVDELLRL